MIKDWLALIGYFMIITIVLTWIWAISEGLL